MRAKDAARLSTIRLLLAAIKQREVDERIERPARANTRRVSGTRRWMWSREASSGTTPP